MAVFFQIDRSATASNELLSEGGKPSATFISLLNFTDQGIRNVKESPDRYEAFRAMAEKLGVKVKGFYYTIGHYDMVLIVEGSDEAAMTAMLKVGSLGNVPGRQRCGDSLRRK